MSLSLENIRSDDRLQRAQAEAFLLDNPDPGVRMRPPGQVDRAVASGQGLVIVEGARIRGVSLVYGYDPGSPGKVDREIGTMRVTAQGLGLQALLAWFHMVQITLEDDATRGAIFAVVGHGTASEHNLTHYAGMTDWAPPPALELMRRGAGVPFDARKRVLATDDTAIGGAFARLRALHLGGNRFRTPKGDAVIEVRMGWFDPSVLTAVR